MTHPTWIALHPKLTSYHLGFLPGFLDTDDPRPAREQFDENYKPAGWMPFVGAGLAVTNDFHLVYPGDPPQAPIAMTKLRDELILLYESEFVAILQKDGTFEVARMD